MLKTNVNKTAKPALPLITFGVIKGYLKHPLWFMLNLMFSFPKFYHSIKLDLPQDFIKSNCFIIHLYQQLQKHFSKATAYEITRAAILCSGLAVMQANFKNVEDLRTFANLVKYQQLAKDKGATKLNTVKVIQQTNNYYEYRVTRCMFYELFNSLNVPELTKIMCTVDNLIFNSYLPNEVTFKRGINKTIADGNVYCEFCLQNNKIKRTTSKN